MRYSGFFVPPLTSLYTFNLLSDDASALYLSPNTSRAHKRLIAEGPQYTRNSWTHFSEQTSSPILLEAGSAYYIEAIHSQGFGPWAIGFGAKIHALNKTSRISFADHELQDIAISSKVVKEKQVCVMIYLFLPVFTVMFILTTETDRQGCSNHSSH